VSLLLIVVPFVSEMDVTTIHVSAETNVQQMADVASWPVQKKRKENAVDICRTKASPGLADQCCHRDSLFRYNFV